MSEKAILFLLFVLISIYISLNYYEIKTVPIEELKEINLTLRLESPVFVEVFCNTDFCMSLVWSSLEGEKVTLKLYNLPKLSQEFSSTYNIFLHDFCRRVEDEFSCPEEPYVRISSGRTVYVLSGTDNLNDIKLAIAYVSRFY